MFSRSFTRILWKEFRVQQSLWLALLAGALLLQFIFIFFTQASQNELQLYPFLVGSVLSTCYAIASGVMLFANEREDKTDRFLQAIAVRPRELMAGKLTYAIVSLALLTALLYLSAMGVTAFTGGEASDFSIWNESQVYASYLHSIPLGLAASIFCSLLIQRVMWGLLLAVAVMLMLNVAAGTSPLLLQRNLSISTLFCAVILLLGSVPLVPVWLRGGPDWSRVKLIAASWFDYRRRFQLTSLLKWAASRASLSNRALGVIVWKELRTASWVLLAGLIVTSGWIPARFLIPYGTFHQSDPIVSTWLMCSLFGSWLLLGTLGLLSFSDDQRQRKNRFYVEHGVSPSLVWVGKQVVWLTVLLVLGAIATYMSIQFGLVSDPFQLNRRQPWSPPVPRQIAIIASYILCSYTTIQLLGQWFRNPIPAAALGVIACSGLTFLHLLLMVFRIPLWLSSGPLMVGALIASLFLMDDWVKERWSWKHFLKRAAWIFVPLAISFAGMFTWRIVEIPLVDPGFDWRAHEREMAQSDPVWTGQWKDLFDLATLPMPARQAMPKPFAERFREMAHQAVQQPQMRIDPEFQVNEPTANTLMFAFNMERIHGIVGTERTSLDEQWQDLQAALRMTFALANASPTVIEYAMSLSTNFSLRDKLRVWAQDPRQTPESLQRLIDCPPLVPSIPIKNNYVTTRQAHYKTGWGKETWIGTRLEDSIGHFPFTLLVGERERLVRLLNQQTKKAITRQAATLPTPKWNEISALIKWESTTPLSYLEAEIFSKAERGFSSCYETAWITSVISRLEKYRIENGHYPERLEEVRWPDWDLINPYDFQYQPHGLPYPLVLSPTFVIPAGQPIIFKATGIRPGGRDLTVNLRSTLRTPSESVERILELIESKEILFANPTFQNSTAWPSTWELLSQTLKNMPEKTERIQNLHLLPPPPGAE